MHFQVAKNDKPGAAGKYPADMANAWIQMQIRLTRSTAGYNSLVSDRSFGYAGITMYQALAAAIPGNRCLVIANRRNPRGNR